MERIRAIDLGSRAGIEWARVRDYGKGFWHPNNLDRKFPYQVPRTVTVQDFRLGGSYRAIQFGLLLTIIFVQVLINGGHLAFEAPFGQVSFQVKRPTSTETPLSGSNSYWNLSDSSRTSATSGFQPTSHLPYCLNMTGPNRFCTSTDPKSPYYCVPGSCADLVWTPGWNVTYAPNGTLLSNVTVNVSSWVGAARRCNGPMVPLQVHRCRYEDEEWIAPIVDEKSILVISRVSWMYQDLLCEVPTNDDTACTKLYKPQTSTQKYLTVSPEYFEIMFDHQVFTPTNGATGKQADAPGAELWFADGRKFMPAEIDPRGNGSFTRPDSQPWIPGYYNILGRHSISVQTLLEAAGITSLDTPAMGLFDSGSTLRYTGVTIMLRIIYTNYKPWGFGTEPTPSYHYEVKSGSTYAAVHAVTRTNATNRLFENRHGIKLVISQEGALAAFDLVNFMIFIVSAVGTLAVASIVVDNVVLRFFIPKRVQQILELASATTVPVRSDLNHYIKAVEENLGGEYQAPETFWEVEKEWIDHQEVLGKSPKRPNFKKTGAIELEKILSSHRLGRSPSEKKTGEELRAEGALAFARSISGPGDTKSKATSSTSARSQIARARWKLAKDGVLKEVRRQRGNEYRAKNGLTPSSFNRQLSTQTTGYHALPDLV